jgi:protein-L-isoaspartate(D-aspartate) O-methyltransferase
MFAESELDDFRILRERMVREQLHGRGIRDERVLDAMGRVPRHEFVPPELRAEAYQDHPIPIGEGQTISQPYIVALMLQDLALMPTDVALEVGTGSGYVAALLGLLTTRVYTIERHAELARRAQEALARTGSSNVITVVGDGSAGLPSHAPFDAILVSAAAASVPPALFEQLAERGRMVVPVGGRDMQLLQLVQKRDGRQLVSDLEGCRFVPLITDP